MGYGIMRYNSGDLYDGEWYENLRHGKGIFTWSDGRAYEGYYKNNLRHGHGTFRNWRDETTGSLGVYEGANADDKFEGNGEFVFDNGDIFVGIFKANQRWEGYYTTSRGDVYRIENGVRIS
jgi:hypothetical protein